MAEGAERIDEFMNEVVWETLRMFINKCRKILM